VFDSEERGALRPLPPRPFVPVLWKRVRVHSDSHVVFEKRLYSVPYKHLHTEAWVQATPDRVNIYVDDELVAVHDRRGPGPRSTEDAHLPVGRADFRSYDALPSELPFAAPPPTNPRFARDVSAMLSSGGPQ
jgi:hypothetical protein